MARRLRCPRCGHRSYWILRDGRRRCASCRYDWRPWRLPLRLTPRQWRQVLGGFVRGMSTHLVAQTTGVGRKRVLRSLTVVRRTMARAIPRELSGMVEIIDTLARGSGLRGQRLKQALAMVSGSMEQVFPPEFRRRIEIDKEFWSYLERRLVSRRGVRRERVRLYLSEHIWRYTHRALSQEQQVSELLKLIREKFHSGD